MDELADKYRRMAEFGQANAESATLGFRAPSPQDRIHKAAEGEALNAAQTAENQNTRRLQSVDGLAAEGARYNEIKDTRNENPIYDVAGNSDIGRGVLGGLVRGVGTVAEGTGFLTDAIVGNPISKGLEALGKGITAKGQAGLDTRSLDTQYAIEDTRIGGNILTGEGLTFGKDPSIAGLLHQVIPSIAEMAPQLAALFMSGGAGIATSVGTGVAQAGISQGNQNYEEIMGKSENEMFKFSDAYKELRQFNPNISHEEAQREIADTGKISSAVTGGIIGGAGGAMTRYLWKGAPLANRAATRAGAAGTAESGGARAAASAPTRNIESAGRGVSASAERAGRGVTQPTAATNLSTVPGQTARTGTQNAAREAKAAAVRQANRESAEQSLKLSRANALAAKQGLPKVTSAQLNRQTGQALKPTKPVPKPPATRPVNNNLGVQGRGTGIAATTQRQLAERGRRALQGRGNRAVAQTGQQSRALVAGKTPSRALTVTSPRINPTGAPLNTASRRAAAASAQAAEETAERVGAQTANTLLINTLGQRAIAGFFEEGIEEAAEGIGATLAVNAAIGSEMEVGRDSFGDFILGGITGASINATGVLRGAASEKVVKKAVERAEKVIARRREKSETTDADLAVATELQQEIEDKVVNEQYDDVVNDWDKYPPDVVAAALATKASDAATTPQTKAKIDRAMAVMEQKAEAAVKLDEALTNQSVDSYFDEKVEEANSQLQKMTAGLDNLKTEQEKTRAKAIMKKISDYITVQETMRGAQALITPKMRKQQLARNKKALQVIQNGAAITTNESNIVNKAKVTELVDQATDKEAEPKKRVEAANVLVNRALTNPEEVSDADLEALQSSNIALSASTQRSN